MEFEEFLNGLQRLRKPLSAEESLSEKEKEAIHAFQRVRVIDRRRLARFIGEYPAAVPLLASCVGLSLEQLRAELQHRFRSSSWVKLARQLPDELIISLEEVFRLRNEKLIRDYS